jgi:hypothetical protein
MELYADKKWMLAGWYKRGTSEGGPRRLYITSVELREVVAGVTLYRPAVVVVPSGATGPDGPCPEEGQTLSA